MGVVEMESVYKAKIRELKKNNELKTELVETRIKYEKLKKGLKSYNIFLK